MLDIQIKSKLKHYMLDVEFSVKEELAVLFGPSGAGKTTILKAIAGIYRPDKGKIRLHGRTLLDTPSISLPPQKRKVGFVFQEYALFPHLNVLSNIKYGLHKSQQLEFKNHVNRLIEEFSIAHLLDQYPEDLSGGEKQRVALARALAQKPGVLLMDEPFSALDEATRDNGHNVIERLKKEWKIPMLLVTHNKQEADKLGDKVIHIGNGKQI